MRHECVLTTTIRGCVRYVKDSGWFGGSLTGLIVPLPRANPLRPCRGHADLRTWRSNENICPIYGNRSRTQVHDTNTLGIDTGTRRLSVKTQENETFKIDCKPIHRATPCRCRSSASLCVCVCCLDHCLVVCSYEVAILIWNSIYF